MNSLKYFSFSTNTSRKKICRRFYSKFHEKLKIGEKWNSVVGLEVHAQISSKSKLFSDAGTAFASPINSSVSFFDSAIPGTLPVLNKRCVEAGVKTALALSCKVNQVSMFDRKHYFYSDLPTGYQITQQRKPLAVDGIINFHVFNPYWHKKPYSKQSKIKQLQLEQDSGRSLHDDENKRSLIDLNRAGMPLMELVFEPDLGDGEEAASLIKELCAILERLGTCSCKMEEGAFRVDANVSVNRLGEPLGIRTEIKNIGSVRAVAAAINFEIERQILMLDEGRKIVNETRAWNAECNKTVAMRDKEDKQDYRFMPEPNLPPLRLHIHRDVKNENNLIDVPYLQDQLPEMPEETRQKLKETFSISQDYIKVITNDSWLLEIFYNIIKNNEKRSANIVAKILVNFFLEVINKNKLKKENCPITQEHLGEVIDLLENESINLNIVKKVLPEILLHPQNSPKQIIIEKNWFQITDNEELTRICQKIIDDNPKALKQYKGGKKKVFQFFINQVTKSTDERANVNKAIEIFKKLFNET
ncbi:glutamyl-tRNA(Gln) amidotransferase subunit B, mitochondrial [Leptopilina boulardi]|uniref:glutamyl-tRNA(Gln) amidotransferase subunit B, mitochondrial n=1 Tax=Leptopilina boulardi TaxID=63433 RepID=UPI0021F5A535|nr:glutamyl-tRNA(Gln) amidotransferase subunit B, mitochondrial [Leptopilina boulardi]XP_051173169.1 glutamyl-tRNA(Gln) amidotransferase subunit B, mitochondrial [Leptopilina boulardi]XP_051173176.1 glutamyl-tRNA(Gln) amidotransferase subunit B, mitochondrial [Leptopilina boulardi]